MIIVNINPEETYARVAGLWQYDYGQVLRIQGLSLPPAIEIHFSLQETGGETVTRVGITKDGVTDVVIPDFILDGAGAIEDYFAYAFIYPSDENSGQTEHRIEIGVKSRPKPEGYKGSGDDTMGAIMKAVNEIAAGKADGLEYKNSILRLMAGETELARVTISGGSGGGADAREIELQKSETAIQWRYVGEEEWKDLVDLADLNGVTPHIGDNGNWYIGETDTGVKAEAPSTDSTLTESGKAADAKITGEKISELKGEIDQLKQAGAGSGSGANIAQANSLWAIIQKAAFAEVLTDEELNDFKTAWGITTENIPATGITLDKSTLSFTDSASQTLVATVEPSDTTDKVVWTSNAESVATVANGVVKPVSNGSATITATCGSVLATCSVTVDMAGEEQATLTSISATYTGGEVATGTDLSSLTGITVTATYSDGTTKTVTDYTLSGEILEGENTITVSYGGKTTTVTVTGIVESGGDTTAELPTDGLVDYFDFRICEYNNVGSGGSTLINASQGNGGAYCWANNQVKEQGEYGIKSAGRVFMYSASATTTQTKLGTTYTVMLETKGAIIPNPLGTFTNSVTYGANIVLKYTNTDGSEIAYNTGLTLNGYYDKGSDTYNAVIIVVDGSVCRVYWGNNLLVEIDGTTIDGFVSWFDKANMAAVTNISGGYMCQMAIYEKALSNIEITELVAYLKTLEVA